MSHDDNDDKMVTKEYISWLAQVIMTQDTSVSHNMMMMMMKKSMMTKRMLVIDMLTLMLTTMRMMRLMM